MREIGYFINRNILIYKRDKAYVFFSVLSMLVLLGLMVLFLGKNNVDSLYHAMETYSGENTDIVKMKENATFLIYLWTLSGALATNGITVPLTIYSNMIKDEQEGKLQAFFTAPMKRYRLTLGYILSSWIIGFVMCLFTLIIGQIYFALIGMSSFDLLTFLRGAGAMLVSTLVYSVMGYTIAIFVHSASAWSGFLTILGTLVGFLGGMYLPFGSLETAIRNLIACLPVIHGAALVRYAVMGSAMNTCFTNYPIEFADAFKNQMGIKLSIGDFQVSPCQSIILLVSYMLISLAVSLYVTGRRKIR